MGAAQNFHINQTTQRAVICRAKPGNCPLKTEDGKPMPHFDNKASAKQWVEREEAAKAEQNGNALGGVTRKTLKTAIAKDVTEARVGQRETPAVKKMRETIKANTKKVVESRSANDVVALEGADPERAERRLKESIEYASKRQNVHLMEKLSKSVVLPSGAFKRSDGSRFNTDTLLKNRQIMKNIDEERKKLEDSLGNVLYEGGVEGTKFTVKDETGTYTATVTRNNFSEEAFSNLPANVQEQLLKDEVTIDVDLARERLSPKLIAQVTTKTQVLDYVNGKQYPVAAPVTVDADLDADGGTPDEKMQRGVERLAKLYAVSREVEGSSYKKLKADNADMVESMKIVSNHYYGETGKNTFIPARSQYNGAVVTGRVNISRTELAKHLSERELAEVSRVKKVPDREKAAKVLSREEFGRIFEQPGVSLRVSEK